LATRLERRLTTGAQDAILPHNLALGLAVLILSAVGALAQTDALTSGVEAFHRGDYVTAERNLKQSTDPRARAFLALTLAATGRCDAAISDLAKAFDSSDAGISRLGALALAQCDLARNRFDEASAVVSKLLLRYPSDADVLYQAARLHMRAWNDTVYQLYKKAPSSFRVNQLSGEILETQGQFAEAAAEYRKAIEKNPKALNLHFRLGRALLMSSHSPETLDSALKEFQAELGLNPSDPIGEYEVAQVLLAQGKNDAAAPRLEHALDLNPEFPEALIALGKIRLDQKKNDEAIVLLQRAVKLAPASEPAHYTLMLAYRNTGKMAEARAEKAELDKLQKTPEGEFSEFLKKLGEKPSQK
jgi:tetratricopeptide (TPR) repeat protein